MQQACALPYRRQDGKIEFCLITTRRTVRWAFPKGSVDRGESLSEAALRESLEEAGVEGVIRGDPLGEFVNTSYDPPRTVTVFLMEVTGVLDQWLEEGERQRCWCEAGEALGRLEFEPLRELLQKAVGRLTK